MQNDSSLCRATQRDPGNMTPEDAMLAPATRTRGRSWELLLITQHSCDGLQRHHSLLAFSVETKRSTRGPTAFACLWREIQANISTTDTSSLGNHLSEHRVCSLCLSSRSSMLVRGSPFVLASPVLSLPLHLARSSKSPSLFVLRMWDVVRIQHFV